MKYRKLGSSDLQVSCLAFGCWQLADTGYWGEDGSPVAAVHAALDVGVNLFDVAELYADGECERVLGQALKGERDQVLIASKVKAGHCSRDDLARACEDSLRRLRTDRIDLYQVHWPDREVCFPETMEVLERLKQEGKILEIGLSNFAREDLETWMQSGTAVSDQLGYNLLFRAIEFDVVPACERYDLGILVYMPLLQGILAGKWQTIDDIPVVRRRTRHFSSDREGPRHGGPGHEVLLMEALRGVINLATRIGQSPAALALAWLLAQPRVSSVIAGGRKPEQVTGNLAAVEMEIDPTVLADLDAITEPLRDAMGPEPDMWLDGEQSRMR